MKKRNLVMVTLFCLVLVTGFTACRHGHHAGGFDEFDLEAITGRIASKLDLTESQKTDFKEMAAEFAAKAKEMHTDRDSRHGEMADLIRQVSINREAVDQMIAEKFDRMHEVVAFAAERLIQFHATLTPDQREKIAHHIEEHPSGRGRFFHR